MADFSSVPGLSGYQQQVALNQQQDAGQLTRLAQLLGIQNDQMKMQMLQKQIDTKNALGKALLADAMPAAEQQPYGGGYSPSVAQAFGVPAGRAQQPVTAAVSSADRLMAAARQAGDYDAYQEAIKLKLEEKKAAPKFATDVRVVMIGGKPTAVQMADDGSWRPMGEGVGPAEKLHFADNGQMIQGLNPYTGAAVGGGIAKQATPGELLTDSRTRSEGALNRGQAERHFQNPSLQHIETDQGIFSFNPKTAATAPVNGPDGKPLEGSKGLTEVQAKGVGFATRAREASDIINKVGKGGDVQPGIIKRVAESVPMVGEGLGTLANVTQSAQQQQVEQAQRNFVNAILRQESGAAISESEFQNAKKQYFPQPGDTPEVIRQKAQNRETSIIALETQAGPGMKKVRQAGIGTRKPDIQAQADAILGGK